MLVDVEEDFDWAIKEHGAIVQCTPEKAMNKISAIKYGR